MKGGEPMKTERVNADLYLKIKAAVESGDYTVGEAAAALNWVRSEYIRKRNPVMDAIKVNEISILTTGMTNTTATKPVTVHGITHFSA